MSWMWSCQLDIVRSLSLSSWARAGVELAMKLPARNRAIKNHLTVFISSPPFVGFIFFLGQPPCQSFAVKNLCHFKMEKSSTNTVVSVRHRPRSHEQIN